MLQPCVQIPSPCAHMRGLSLGATAHGCFADDCCLAGTCERHPITPCLAPLPTPTRHAPCTRLLACTNALTNTHVCACTRAGCKAWRPHHTTMWSGNFNIWHGWWGWTGSRCACQLSTKRPVPSGCVVVRLYAKNCVCVAVCVAVCAAVCVAVCAAVCVGAWLCGRVRIHTHVQTLKSTVALTPVRRGRRTGRTGVPT